MNILHKIQEAFKGLTFQEKGHKYTVDGVKIEKSVSSLIHSFYEPFDSDYHSARIAERDGRTQAEVLKEWKDINDESIERGHRVHLFGERYQDDRTLTPSCNQELALTKFWADLPPYIVPVGAEIRMYHYIKKFAGTSDILLYNMLNGTYIIADYKTNKDLYKNFKGKTMLPPFEDLLDCPLSHYEVQLSYYQILLEQIPGIKISRRIVIWLLMNGEYSVIDTRDFTDRLKTQMR
jgi:ATP-dependent exoDNAse (exonuclease V) beta subunit